MQDIFHKVLSFVVYHGETWKIKQYILAIHVNMFPTNENKTFSNI